MTDGQIRELLRDLQNEPIPPDSLARVRAKVGERTEAAPWWGLAWWKVAVPMAAVAAVLVLMFSQKDPPEPVMVVRTAAPLPPPVTVAKEPPATVIAKEPPATVIAKEPPATVIAKEPPPHQVITRRKPAPPRPVVPNGASEIRIETPDPDVVIILVAGSE